MSSDPGIDGGSATGSGAGGVTGGDSVYRVTEIVGTSTDGVQSAIDNGIARAAQTLRNLDWFEVTEIRGHIEEGRIGHVQVGLKVGFKLE